MKRSILFITLFFIFVMVINVFISSNIYAENGNVAKINGIEYETFPLAVENAKEGETITLLKDITVTKEESYIANLPANSILDLNGHTITIGFMALIFTGDNITIKNGKFSSEASYSFWIGDEESTKGVTVENIETIGGINIYNATDVVIKNTIAVGNDYYSVWIDNGANAKVESGTYTTEGKNGLVGVSSDNDINDPLVITGGTFITNDGKLAVASPYLPPKILGGKYNTDVKAYLIDGYKCILSEDYYLVSKIKQEVELIPEDSNKNENKITINTSDIEDTKNIFLDTLNSTSDIDISNKDVKVVMDINSEKVSEADRDSVKNKVTNINGKINVTDFFDIEIEVIDTISNQVLGKLSTLNRKIKLNIDLPQELKDIKNGYKRVYYVVRKHGENIELLDTKLSSDGNSITFETDKFSTYALAYVDEPISNEKSEIKNPDTGVTNESLYIFYESFISLITVIGIVIYINRKKLFN